MGEGHSGTSLRGQRKLQGTQGTISRDTKGPEGQIVPSGCVLLNLLPHGVWGCRATVQNCPSGGVLSGSPWAGTPGRRGSGCSVTGATWRAPGFALGQPLRGSLLFTGCACLEPASSRGYTCWIPSVCHRKGTPGERCVGCTVCDILTGPRGTPAVWVRAAHRSLRGLGCGCTWTLPRRGMGGSRVLVVLAYYLGPSWTGALLLPVPSSALVGEAGIHFLETDYQGSRRRAGEPRAGVGPAGGRRPLLPWRRTQAALIAVRPVGKTMAIAPRMTRW